ncbi:MAG: cyclopropane-fatty-acyl-phospholipid synthase family protein [Burkholderiales bacterium]
MRLGAALASALLVATSARAQEAPQQAPFITTPPEVVARMLELARTGPADVVLDLGSGDGRIVIQAARAHGARGLGVDLDPALVARARENAARAGVADRARFAVQDALRTDLSGASVVTIYLLPWLLERLETRLLYELRPGARIVTHAFPLGSWPADRIETVRLSRSHEGQGDSSRIFLHVVPAQARGAWGAAGGWRMRIAQNYQRIDVELEREGARLPVRVARLEGERIEIEGTGFDFRGHVRGGRIEGVLEGVGSLVFERVP